MLILACQIEKSNVLPHVRNSYLTSLSHPGETSHCRSTPYKKVRFIVFPFLAKSKKRNNNLCLEVFHLYKKNHSSCGILSSNCCECCRNLSSYEYTSGTAIPVQQLNQCSQCSCRCKNRKISTLSSLYVSSSFANNSAFLILI